MGWTKLLMELGKTLGVGLVSVGTEWGKQQIRGKPNQPANGEQRLKDIERNITKFEKALAETQAQAEKGSQHLALWLSVILFWCGGLTVVVIVLLFKYARH